LDFELMRLSELARYHIPPSLIDSWRKRQGDMLLPLQSEVLHQGLLADESGAVARASSTQSFLISAPTSTGKTFCGELALAGAVVRRRKGVFLVPLKSIAEEKFAEFEPLYRQLNLKCIIATADHPEHNRALERGEFDIAVCVYEKFNRALLTNIDLLGRIGALVIDEAQLLEDPERGTALEGLLLKLAGYRQASVSGGRAVAPMAPRLIALTASLASDRALAERLGARLIRETRRPVELRQGVLCNGVYRYFNRDTGEIGSEEFRTAESPPELSWTQERAAPIADELLERLRIDDGPTLVFLNERRRVIGAALALASCGRWSRAAKPLDDLQGEEPSSVVRSLCQSLTCGVAFHSADLTAFQRGVVERGFRSGEIAVIFCTTTLGLGVNLPAETVYIEPVKYTAGVMTNPEGGRKSGGPSMVPLPRAEFENMAGRAGRYGCRIATETESGRPVARAVLLARTEFERDVLWENYIEPSQRFSAGLSLVVDEPRCSDRFAALALETLVCGLAPTLTRLRATFAALANSGVNYSQRHTAYSDSACAEPLSGAVERLRQLGLTSCGHASEDSDGEGGDLTLVASELGQAVAASGLSLAGVAHYVGALKRIQPTSASEWLALALSAPDFLAVGAGVTPLAAGAVARQLFTALPDSAERLLMCLSGGTPVSSPVSVSGASRMRAPQLVIRIRSFLALEAWRAGERAHFLETRCQMSLAQVARMGQDARWLLQGLSDIAIVTGSLGVESDIAAFLTGLMNSLRYGLPGSALTLRESFSQSAENQATNQSKRQSVSLTGLFNRAELMEFDRSDCRTAADVAVFLTGRGSKALNDTSINPASALKFKTARLHSYLASFGPAPTTSPATSRAPQSSARSGAGSTTRSTVKSMIQQQHNTTHSTEEERNMREQVMTEHPPQVVSHAPLGAGKAGVPITALGLVPCSLHVDGASRGERFMLRVDGLPVALTGKSFKYLIKLVCARLSQTEGWIYKDDIEIGFNQARYLYRMRREIAAQLPGYRWSVYENNRLGYYRLALDSAAIDVNRETLLNSPDYEVAQVAAALAEASPASQTPELPAEGRRLG
jgi:DEAD/DEAH box helicase/Helicase conserved C-terminal domain